ncbi:MAG TPA: flagellar assembly protein A, partial [Symbiobacteriaceae bacterium]|nr:flagellar assembly protein A [Symbiobacteriaceae bacterium]
EVRSDRFCTLTLAEDRMAATMVITADPHRVPDTIQIEGQHPAILRPGYTASAPRRGVSPKAAILEQMRAEGIQYGIDELAIERGLSAPMGQPAIVARGQEPKEADPGQWTWRLDMLGLVQAGQLITVHEGGHSSLPRITVTGEEEAVYGAEQAPPAYTPGPGTRLMAGGKLVAASSGRARAIPTATGHSVQVVPVQVIDGDWTGSLAAAGDLIVRGNVRDATITTSGEVVVMGDIEKSEISAAGIGARNVALSKLSTMPVGHHAPLRGELAFLQRRLEELGDSGAGVPVAVKETWFREAHAFARFLWRKADEIGVADPHFKAAVTGLFSLLGAEAATSFNRATGQALSARLAPLVEEAMQIALSGDVQARSMSQTTVWAGRNISVQNNIAGCTLFCGGTVESSSESTCTQTEIVAGTEVRLGTMASLRGTLGVSVRSRRVEAREIQVGCSLEFGSERKEIQAELFNVTVGVSGRGSLMIKQG